MAEAAGRDARVARRGVIATTVLLAVLAVITTLIAAPWPLGIVLAAASLLPLLLPLRGILAGSRRAHAVASLCVLPYFIAGLTETIANPRLRLAGACLLFGSIAWFVALVWYLRVTRPAMPLPPPGPPAPA